MKALIRFVTILGVAIWIASICSCQNKPDTPPVAKAGAEPTVQAVGQPVHLFNSGSFDPDGGQLWKYEWDWDNDGTFDDVGPSVYHTWDVPGTYLVQFQVTDVNLETGMLKKPIEITITAVETPPVAKADADPKMQLTGQQVHFFDTGSYDPDGGSIALYEWDWDNDGTYDQTGSDVYNSWDTSGTYHVQFRVTDDEGVTATLENPIEIIISTEKFPPVAKADADPEKQLPGGQVHFFDTGSYDPDGGSIALYEWDWDNDGTFDQTGPDVYHSWDTAGIYHVQFRVTDDEGGTDILDQPIVITISQTGEPPVLDQITSDRTTANGAKDETITIVATAHDPDGGVLTYNFQGSGTFSNQVDGTVTWKPSGSQLGRQAITVTVSDESSLQDQDSIDLWSTNLAVVKGTTQGMIPVGTIESVVPATTINMGTDFAGKVVFINFWATWCGYCVAEMPDLTAVYDNHKSDPDYNHILMDLQEDSGTVQGFIGSHSYTCSYWGLDADGTYFGKCGQITGNSSGIPQSLLFDRDNQCRWIKVGALGDTGALEDAIGQLL
jgi:thiol-disulfide isomerase/thioredoxin